MAWAAISRCSLSVGKPMMGKARTGGDGKEWADYCDCYIKPDLVLIYRKPDAEILEPVRGGLVRIANWDCNPL